ncbi:MAG: DUF5026 domain-containing protein [Oscillospiraceae bacterium]|jgi:hypothetical protein|nr:DUF5026 domain-containing protein [Oscillospiraceae bacterium]
MALIADKDVKVFDLTEIHRGDCVRVRKNGDDSFRNGVVIKAEESKIVVLYSNIQNEATSYLFIFPADVADDAWEMYWTTDFVTINHIGGDGNA